MFNKKEKFHLPNLENFISVNERVNIIGNRIDCFPDFPSLYSHLLQSLKVAKKAGYITVNNVHTMMEAYNNPSFKEILNNSSLSIPDGKPLEIVGKLKGCSGISRLFGPTLMEKFIDWGRKDGVKHFFIGSSHATLDLMKAVISQKYPGAQVCGAVSPPFLPVNEWPNETYIQMINQEKPDFIWVGLGAPKQEAWMSNHCPSINYGYMVGIGAGFDYLAGNTKHAPKWMKNASLEWLYRLVQEPRRLWKRYFLTIPPFIVLASIDIIRSRFHTK